MGTIVKPANVISGNTTGILVAGGQNNRVQGNFIGTDKSGNSAVANKEFGIAVGIGSDNTLVGGATDTFGNVIAGNGNGPGPKGGLYLSSNTSTVRHNKIGVANNGTTALGNQGPGVHLSQQATSNYLSDNVIKNNTIKGVRDEGQKNTIAPSNTIAANDGLGIDIGLAGITLDGMPVLTSVTSNGTTTTVSGTLLSTPHTNFVLGIYGNMTPDPSGYGEGEVLLGTINVLTNSAGYASFSTTLSLAYGTHVSATATDLDNGGTSEFSGSFLVNTVTPPPTVGTAQVGSWVWLDSDGDGQRDAGEAMLQGIVVTLTNVTTGQTWTTTTDSQGQYLFSNLAGGDYFIHFALPTGYEFTDQHQGNSATDSDADQLDGNSQVFSLTAFDFKSDIDAGLVLS